MRRTALIILGIAGGLVALVLVAVAIAVATVDVNALAEPLASRIRAATGRQVVIGGPIGLHLSLEPTLRIDNVALGNAPWGRNPTLLKVARVEAQVALLPLLQRRFEIVRVTLVDPVFFLETDRQGNGNWVFKDAQAAGAGGAGPEAVAIPALGVGELEIRNGRLIYLDGVTGATTPVQIETLTLQSRDPAAPISGEFRGSINGIPIALKGNLGSRAMLQAQQWPYPIEIIGTIAGRSTTLQGKLTPAQGTTRIDALSVAFGELALTGSVVVDRSGARPRYVVDLRMPRFVPEAFALPVVAAGAGQPSTPPAPPATASRHLVSDRPIPLGALRAAEAEGTIAIDAIDLPHGQSITQAKLRFGLHAGRLDVVDLSGSGLGGTVLVRGVLSAQDDAAKGATLDVHVEGRELELRSLMALSGAPREVTGGKTRFTFDGKASGVSLHDWVASLDGTAVLLVGAAQMRNPPGSSTAVLDQLGAAVNPFRAKTGGTDLRCAVARVPIQNGIARIDRSMAFETAELGVSASGTLDFRDETLDLTLRPQVRSGIPIDIAGLADLVRVKGPFDHPQVGIDPAKSAETVARIGAAIGTGGWSLLGETLLNATEAPDSPCAIALGVKSVPAAGTASSSAAQASQLPADLGKALGKLFGR